MMTELSTQTTAEYRDSCGSTDGEDETEIFFNVTALSSEITDEDSESEFIRILDKCRKQREYAASELGENSQPQRLMSSEKTMFDAEYYSLSAIEKLNIQVKEETEFKKFGTVDSHVNFLVKIKPDKDVPHLGYETILFDRERIPIGEIFEIFGTVNNTFYALRFNDEEEAKRKLPIGEEVFYALSDNNVTKPIFTQELAKLKTWDRQRTNSGNSSSEELFSDDEEEMLCLAKKTQKSDTGKGSRTSREKNYIVPNKRKRIVAAKRHGSQPNPFRFNYPQPLHWQQSSIFGHPVQSSGLYFPATTSAYGPPPIMNQSWNQGRELYSYLSLPPPPPPPLPSSNWLSLTDPTHQFFKNQNYIPQRPFMGSKPLDQNHYQQK